MKCLYCKKSFEADRPGQGCCSYQCALSYSRGKVLKEKKIKDKEIKEKLKTKSELLKELQVIFNKYIRLRDKDRPCISCGKLINGVRHASHFRSIGSSPSLRFNEDNVWVSCYKCNVMLSGNQLEYRQRLTEIIGIERVEALDIEANKPKHYTIEEINELKIKYKKLIKNLSI